MEEPIMAVREVLMIATEDDFFSSLLKELLLIELYILTILLLPYIIYLTTIQIINLSFQFTIQISLSFYVLVQME
jgi:hypothetical protein